MIYLLCQEYRSTCSSLIQGGNNLGQRGLCKRVITSSTKALLFGSLERLSKSRKHLGAHFSNVALLKADQLVSQKLIIIAIF